jgi:hypothetical protein
MENKVGRGWPFLNSKDGRGYALVEHERMHKTYVPMLSMLYEKFQGQQYEVRWIQIKMK